MIISEKQVMHLMFIATEYRRELLVYKDRGLLTLTGQTSLDDTSAIIASINNQQSDELKVVSNE